MPISMAGMRKFGREIYAQCPRFQFLQCKIAGQTNKTEYGLSRFICD